MMTRGSSEAPRTPTGDIMKNPMSSDDPHNNGKIYICMFFPYIKQRVICDMGRKDDWMDFNDSDWGDEKGVKSRIPEGYLNTKQDENPPQFTMPQPPPIYEARDTRVKLNIGSYIGFVAIVIIIIGILLPWYFVDISVKSKDYDTGGRENLMRFGGIHGFKLDFPESRVGNFTAEEQDNITKSVVETVPVLKSCNICSIITILIVVITEIIVIVSYLRDKRRTRGNKFIWHGALVLIPIVISLALIPTVVANFIETQMPTEGEPAVESLLTILRNPMGGNLSVEVEDGTVALWWGFDIGLWLIIIGGIMAIIGGIVDRIASPKER